MSDQTSHSDSHGPITRVGSPVSSVSQSDDHHGVAGHHDDHGDGHE